MNRKIIVILGIITILGFIGILVIYIFLTNNDFSEEENTVSQNQEIIDQSVNIVNEEDNMDIGTYQYIWKEIPISLLSKLNINQKSKNIFWHYSSRLKIAFTYEPSNIIDATDVRVGEIEEKIYVYIALKPKESGQSIEVINIDPNLRFNTIPEIITQQILIADEKVGCRVEEKNGRYSIKPKNSTQTCGNYADINNKFFVKPTEDGSAISKLIFVNAGNQELSYDGSMKGKYWYESVIVE